MMRTTRVGMMLLFVFLGQEFLHWNFDLISVPSAAAQKKKKRKTRRKARTEKSQVLDFEGDVIEGEDQRPDLLVLIGEQKLDLDSFVLIRKNFHDFHRVDRKKRTGVVGR